MCADEVYIPITEMPRTYPHFCETECLAWSQYRGGCNGVILGRAMCRWSVNKITARISDRSKINGSQWWKKRRTAGTAPDQAAT
jgi:hypothetical protein